MSRYKHLNANGHRDPCKGVESHNDTLKGLHHEGWHQCRECLEWREWRKDEDSLRLADNGEYTEFRCSLMHPERGCKQEVDQKMWMKEPAFSGACDTGTSGEEDDDRYFEFCKNSLLHMTHRVLYLGLHHQDAVMHGILARIEEADKGPEMLKNLCDILSHIYTNIQKDFIDDDVAQEYGQALKEVRLLSHSNAYK